jgi:monoamine oxidase
LAAANKVRKQFLFGRRSKHLFRRFSESGSRMRQKECVVIGAGLAGLAAAYRLTHNHCKVTVLEARDRLGGRVRTHHFLEAPGLNCELGGEWIGKNHTEMRKLCRAMRLAPQPHQYANSFWNEVTPAQLIPPGKWCLSAEAHEIWQRFAAKFMTYGPKRWKEMDKIDWWTQLKLLGFSREDLLRRDLMDSTDFGETIRMNSAYTAATEYLSSKGETVDDSDEMDFKVPGGNTRLVDALARAIRRKNIRTEQTVVAIHQKLGRVTIEVESNRPVSADFCVCTIPAHCLLDIDWGKNPPKEKLEAAKQLQYARITKTAVLCSHRFWPKPREGGFSVCTNLASDFCFDSTYRQKGTKRILCSYAVGDKADDIASSPQDKLKYWIVEDVAHAHGLRWDQNKSVRTALAIEQEAWQADRFTRGAYAFYRPGQWFTVMPALKKRFGRVLFAGEHIAEWQGFMEGAVVTGYAAADAILKS